MSEDPMKNKTDRRWMRVVQLFPFLAVVGMVAVAASRLPGFRVPDSIVPYFDTDEYPTHLATYGKGGLRTVADTSQLAQITTLRREPGMVVYVTNQGNFYKLAQDLTTWTVWPGDSTNAVTDGDKGDISVAGGVWTIDSGVVSTGKLSTGAVAFIETHLTESEASALYQGTNAVLTLLQAGDGTGLTSLNGSAVTTGTVAAARIDSSIATDSEVAAGYEPLNANKYQGTNGTLTTVANLTGGTTSNFFRGDGGFQQVTTNDVPGLVTDILAAAGSGSGGGDVYTSSNNVFTGENTFQGDTTVSNLTINGTASADTLSVTTLNASNLVGVDFTMIGDAGFVPTNSTPDATNILGHLRGIDVALATAGGGGGGTNTVEDGLAGQFLIFDGDNWVSADPGDVASGTENFLFDLITRENTWATWTANGGTLGGLNANSFPGAVGVEAVTLSSATNSTGGAYQRTTSWSPSGGRAIVAGRGYITDTNSSANLLEYFVGLTDKSSASAAVDEIGLLHDWNSPYWQLRARNNSSETVVASTVLVQDDQWHNFRIDVAPDSSSATLRFGTNAAQMRTNVVATITNNIPNDVARMLSVGWYLQKEAGSDGTVAARQLLDFVSWAYIRGDSFNEDPLPSVFGTNYAFIVSTGSDSADLRAKLSDETGTGVAVFAGGDIGAATATTPAASDNDTSVATTAFVQTELADYEPLNSGKYQGTNANLTTLAGASITGTGNFMRTRMGVWRSIWIDAGAFVPFATNGATAGTYINPTSGMTEDVFDFVDTTNEVIAARFMLPPGALLSNWQLDARYTQSSATSGTNVMKFYAGSKDVADTDYTFSTAIAVTNAAAATTNTLSQMALTGLTPGGSPATNALLSIKVERYHDSAYDVATGFLRFHGVNLWYQESTNEPSAF